MSKTNVEIRRSTFSAYMTVVRFMEGTESFDAVVDALSASAHVINGSVENFPADFAFSAEDVVRYIWPALVSVSADKTERKVKSAAMLKKALYWENIEKAMASGVVYKAPKNPDDKSTHTRKSISVDVLRETMETMKDTMNPEALSWLEQLLNAANKAA